VLLLFHAGGFIFDDPDHMAQASAIAADLGFRPVVVAYPSYDLRGAITAAKVAARDERGSGPLYAYGDSAGGTLAALLAEADLVDAAATYSPVANVNRFAQQFDPPSYYEGVIGADRALLLRASPGLHDSDLPILAMVADADERYIRDPIRKWIGRDPDVRRWQVAGTHIGDSDPMTYARNAAGAMRWLGRLP
jgi:hypothetical protein